MHYWVAATRQRGLCQAIRLPNSTWAVIGPNLAANAGEIPGCTPTRKQQVIAQGNSTIGLLPMAVDDRSISLKNRHGDWFGVYYGIVDASTTELSTRYTLRPSETRPTGAQRR